MELFFIRHGESEANQLHVFSNRGLGYPLTPNGRRQAHELAASLRDEWSSREWLGGKSRFFSPVSQIQINRIITSPLSRAVQTAEILAQALTGPPEATVSIEVSEALREFDCGSLEGHSDPHSWQLFSALVDAWLAGQERQKRFPGGESFIDIQQRFVPFIQSVVKEADPQARILLVSHGGLYRCMLPLVLSNIDFKFTCKNYLGNCEMVRAEVRGEHLVCRGWGRILIDS